MGTILGDPLGAFLGDTFEWIWVMPGCLFGDPLGAILRKIFGRGFEWIWVTPGCLLGDTLGDFWVSLWVHSQETLRVPFQGTFWVPFWGHFGCLSGGTRGIFGDAWDVLLVQTLGAFLGRISMPFWGEHGGFWVTPPLLPAAMEGLGFLDALNSAPIPGIKIKKKKKVLSPTAAKVGNLPWLPGSPSWLPGSPPCL